MHTYVREACIRERVSVPTCRKGSETEAGTDVYRTPQPRNEVMHLRDFKGSLQDDKNRLFSKKKFALLEFLEAEAKIAFSS